MQEIINIDYTYHVLRNFIITLWDYLELTH